MRHVENSCTVDKVNGTTLRTASEHLFPDAFITHNKGRVKRYDKGLTLTKGVYSVFLADNSNFEIELFNPFSENIGADISINGEALGKLIVIRPGERIFLDRFIEVNKKFLFKTYFVDSNDREALSEIELNGFVQIQFFREYKQKPRPFDTIERFNISERQDWVLPELDKHGILDIKYLPHCSNTTFLTDTDTSINYCHSTIHLTGAIPQVSTVTDTIPINTYSNKIETGRVEKGETSDQELLDCHFQPDIDALYTYRYKIYPISQKPLTKDDIKKSKKFCIECGRKVRNGKDKFCYNCGSML